MTKPTGKDVCPKHNRWIRFQDKHRPCPECPPKKEEVADGMAGSRR